MNTQRTSAVTDLLRDVILDLVTSADEDTLIAAYRVLKGAPEERPSVPPPTRGAPSGEYPAATIHVVHRHARLLKEFRLADIVESVQREQRAISKSAVSGALGRLVTAGELEREGERNSTYRVPKGK